MSPDFEEKRNTWTSLTTQAVTAALNNNWPEAIDLNLTILKDNPEDIEALNRLARAYKESNNLKLAQKTYRQVLIFDRFNPIAQKNLKLLEALPKCVHKPPPGRNHCSPQMFLEEPGKTKVVNLINLAPSSSLLPLSCGDQINLVSKRRTLNAVDANETYLGALPDDLSIKLIKRISAGNRYDAFVKTVSKNCLSIFIREIYRAPRFKNQPTFPGAGGEFYTSGKIDNFPLEETETPTEEESTPEEEPVHF